MIDKVDKTKLVTPMKNKFENLKNGFHLKPTFTIKCLFCFQVSQLKNIIAKLTGQESSSGKSKKKNARPFDMALYKKRHVLLQVAYFGWDFCGFAVQVTSCVRL